jgi:hypothetical protein
MDKEEARPAGGVVSGLWSAVVPGRKRAAALCRGGGGYLCIHLKVLIEIR